MKPSSTFSAALAGALTLFAFSAAIDTADARERRTRAVVTGERGTAVRDSTVQRERGTRTRDTTWTGQNGRQRSVYDQRTRDPSAGTYSREHEVTGRNGNTRNVSTEAQRTGEGAFTVNRDVTGRNGETRTQSGDFTVTRTEDGRSVAGDIATSRNGQVDYTRDVARGDGARSVNATATFEDGTSIQRASSGSCAGGACSASGQVTNRQGETTSWEQSRVRTENGATFSRDATYADGTTRSVDRAREGNGDGTGTVTRTAVDRRGETHTQTGSYVIKPLAPAENPPAP
jgi:hypothetical protein